MAVGNVMETEAQRSSEHIGGWKTVKLKQARRMLLKGLSPQQIGASVRLSSAQVAELASVIDLAKVVPQPELEGFAAWKSRKRQEVERKLVSLAEGHIGALAKDAALLDSSAMKCLRWASDIGVKWLKSNRTESKTPALNFAALAQVQPRQVDLEG